MDNTRYGIFLRPDPTTCWTITQITTALRAQFGLVSSGAFPPHATIVGNLATTSSAEQVVEAVDPIFRKVPSIAVFNSGVVRQGGCYEFNVNLDDSGQQPNTELGQVANAVLSAVLPLSTRVDDAYSTAVEDYTFAGHLGLAGHDLKVDGHLSDEVGEFIARAIVRRSSIIPRTLILPLRAPRR